MYVGILSMVISTCFAIIKALFTRHKMNNTKEIFRSDRESQINPFLVKSHVRQKVSNLFSHIYFFIIGGPVEWEPGPPVGMQPEGPERHEA